MKRFAWAAPLLVLAACGNDPVAACEDYISTANSCATEALGGGTGTTTTATGTSGLDASSFCAAYDGLDGDAKKAAVDAFDCATAAFASADCSDLDSYNTAATDAGTCILGG